MNNFFKKHSTSELRDVAMLCGGAALLVSIAVFLSGNNSVPFFALVEAESATGHNQSSFVPEVVHGRTDCVPDDPADDAEKNDNARKKGDDIAVLGHKILQTLKHRTVSHVKVLGVGEEFPPGKFCFESERFDV